MAKQKRFVIHDEAVNSYGFSVLTSGMNLKRFMENPVMLYAHDNEKDVIGRWENIEVKGTQVLATPVFDMDDPLGAKIANKVARGFLKATSLGLVFDNTKFIANGDDVQLTESEVVECSIVPIPSNPNALVIEDNGKAKKSELKLFYNSGNGFAISGKVSSKIKKQLTLAVSENETLQQRIIKLLELEEEATDEQIFNSVEALVNDLQDTREEQEQEASDLTQLAIQHKYLPPHLKAVQLQAFKEDFYGSKESLLSMFPFQKNSLTALIAAGGTAHKGGIIKNGDDAQTNKPKSQWDLDDYRKFAPRELQANPDLYNRLIDKKFPSYIFSFCII